MRTGPSPSDSTNNERWSTSGERDERSTAISHLLVQSPLPTPTVLVVDLDSRLPMMLREKLPAEFTVNASATHEAGISDATNLLPDLILVNDNLPLIDGLAYCIEVKANIRTDHIPIILISESISDDDLVRAYSAGADGYYRKTSTIAILITHIVHLIRTRRKLYAKFSQSVYIIPSSTPDNTVDKDFLFKAVEYVNSNLRNPQLSVDTIGDLFNISRSQVYRKIKILTGKTVVEFIRIIRLKYALRLMDEKKYNLSEIADLSGFNSLSYFTRSFKSHFGKAPSEYI